MEGIKIEGTLLTLLNEKAQKSSDNCWMGLYQCECGNQKLIRNKDVKAGKTKSCGCMRSKNSKKIKEGEEVPDSYLTLIEEKRRKEMDVGMGCIHVLVECKN